MEFEKLSKLSMEKKKEILSDFIKNDVTYWKKILILMAMMEEDKDTELIDYLIENKIEEINLANKKYNLSLNYSELDNVSEAGQYVSVMGKIINESNDKEYTRACKEVIQILEFIPEEYYNRINPDFIERLEKNIDENYRLSIVEDTKFEDLVILQETKEILSLINHKFWNMDGRNIKINEIFNKKEM